MKDYRSGQLLTGEMKKICIDVLQNFVKDFQEASWLLIPNCLRLNSASSVRQQLPMPLLEILWMLHAKYILLYLVLYSQRVAKLRLRICSDGPLCVHAALHQDDEYRCIASRNNVKESAESCRCCATHLLLNLCTTYPFTTCVSSAQFAWPSALFSTI